jgi:hypothetical protein
MTALAVSLASLAVGQPVQEAPALLAVTRTVAVSGGGYFPVAVALSDGRLAAVVRGGAPHLGKAGRLDWIESADSGLTWSKPRVVADSEWDDRNPAVGEMPDGTIVVAYGECSCYDQNGRYDPLVGRFRLVYRTSGDGGLTWSEPVDLVHPFGNGGSPYGRIVTLPDGTALMSVYGGPRDENRGLFTVGPSKFTDAVGFLVSRDDGRTWGDFHPIARGYNETTLLPLPSGEILAFARSDGDQHTALLRSSDGGNAWSEPERLTLGSQHPADAALLPDGDVLVAYGSRLAPFGVHVFRASPRSDLAAAPRSAAASDSSSTDQGYPSVVLGPDGKAVLLYYAVGTAERPGEEQALCVRFDPGMLPREAGR